MNAYNEWLESSALTKDEKSELLSLNDTEIYEKFYKTLNFGTSGIRGILGLGTNRFNRFVVGQTTKAIADFLNDNYQNPSVVIGYDSRHLSYECSRLCTEILASNGIKVYIFDELCPTPLVSFAIRYYGATAGINITASHNPKEYNGYKVYMGNGAQIDNQTAKIISEKSRKIDILGKYNTMSFDEGKAQGKIILLGDETNEKFIEQSLKMTNDIKCDDFSVVYTPLFGTGRKLGPQVLQKIGIKNVYTVDEQMQVNGDFPNLPKGPNPEYLSAYEKGTELARQKNADLVIANDPDADRIGIMARKSDGEFVHLTGNMTGCLLADYIIKCYNLPPNPMMVKSIVTSQMIDDICKKHNVNCFEAFTGFRFLAEIIDDRKDMNLIFSLEESYGYLVGDFARDKDAITSNALICQMAMFYKNQGKTLVDALEDLYKEYGYHYEETISITLEGAEGAKEISGIMKSLRENPVEQVAGFKVKQIKYFKDGYIYNFNEWIKMYMEGSDVVMYELFDGTKYIIRPSGTEPKVKIYILAKGDSKQEIVQKVSTFCEYTENLFK